jgi:hypothetical protein
LSHPPNADRCCAEATQSKAAGDFGRGLTGAKPLPRDACPPVWFCIDSRQTPVEIKPKLAISICLRLQAIHYEAKQKSNEKFLHEANDLIKLLTNFHYFHI